MKLITFEEESELLIKISNYEGLKKNFYHKFIKLIVVIGAGVSTKGCKWCISRILYGNQRVHIYVYVIQNEKRTSRVNKADNRDEGPSYVLLSNAYSYS